MNFLDWGPPAEFLGATFCGAVLSWLVYLWGARRGQR
jgi:hypothetical protein